MNNQVAAKVVEAASAVQQTMTFSERVQQMIIGSVIGIATVFAILLFLWGFMVVMKYIFNRPEKKKDNKVTEAVVTVVPADNSDTLIAVLSAAVAAMLNTQGAGTKFRIKSFRRTK